MKQAVLIALVSVVLGGCASGELVVPADHPASPHAASAELPEVAALSPGYGSASTAEAPAHTHDHAAPTATVYTCPMHPEITRSEPGSCPICKMDLVPKKADK